MLQTFLHTAAAPGIFRGYPAAIRPGLSGLGRFGLCFQLIGQLNQPFRSVRPTVEHHVFYDRQDVGRNIAIHHRRGGIDDAHVHPLTAGMVEEHGVHGLADIVVAPERERKVAHPATHMRPGEVTANPARSTDKVHGIVVMFLHSRGYGQHVRVEYDIMGIETDLVHQQTVSPCADFYLAFISIGLPLFIKSHHDDGRPKAFHLPGMGQEDFLPFFQRDGIDDALALHAFQSGCNHVPFGRIYHDGHAGNLRLGGQQVQERHHLLPGIEKPVVHVDVDDQGTILHLLAGDFQSLFVVFLFDQPQEFTRTGHIATFAHIDEPHFRRQFKLFQTAQTQCLCLSGRHMRTSLRRQGRKTGDILVRRTATASDDIHPTFVHKEFHFLCHLVGGLVIFSHTIGQSCVRIDRYIIR